MTKEPFSSLIEHAIELSAQWHDRTYRKGAWRDPAFWTPHDEPLQVPVSAHVTAVALIVQRAGCDDTTVAAAFLHDIIEDGNLRREYLRYEQLCEAVGQEVADIVRHVTESKLDDEGNPRFWRERKEMYVEHLAEAPAEAVAVSLADKLHNLWSINETIASGHDPFKSDSRRKGLTAGPEEQLWFHRAVLQASREKDDARLIPMRDQLAVEIRRLERLTGRDARHG